MKNNKKLNHYDKLMIKSLDFSEIQDARSYFSTTFHEGPSPVEMQNEIKLLNEQKKPLLNKIEEFEQMDEMNGYGDSRDQMAQQKSYDASNKNIKY